MLLALAPAACLGAVHFANSKQNASVAELRRLASVHLTWLDRSAFAQPLDSFAVILVLNVSNAASCVDERVDGRR